MLPLTSIDCINLYTLETAPIDVYIYTIHHTIIMPFSKCTDVILLFEKSAIYCNLQRSPTITKILDRHSHASKQPTQWITLLKMRKLGEMGRVHGAISVCLTDKRTSALATLPLITCYAFMSGLTHNQSQFAIISSNCSMSVE